MERDEFYNQIHKYVVRIGIDDINQTLCGTGTLFPLKVGKEMYVLTVAHVVLPLKQKLQKEGQVICLTCKGDDGVFYNIIIDNPKDIFIHSKYKECSGMTHRGNYFHDSAIIRIPWESWMDELNGYQLENGNNGIFLSGYGFPESLDGERDEIDLFAGESLFEGSIESRNSERFAVKYNPNVDGEIPRDSIMEGYSGTGLFSLETQGFCFRGMISCSRGERTAGFKLWATNIQMIFDVMNENNIEIEFPDSFQIYKDMVASEIPSFKKVCIRNWKESVDEIIKDDVIPKMFEKQVESTLPCEGNRKTCANFWKGKLKELVIMHDVQGRSKAELIRPLVQLPQPYDGDVILEFLCTELKAELILGKMIEDRQFAKNGGYYNNMIILLNGKKDMIIMEYAFHEAIVVISWEIS